MNHCIASSLLFLASCLLAPVAERPLPEQLRPLAPAVGEWRGAVEMRITHQGKTQVLHYAKTTTCRLGDDGKSIVMEDREVSPWTGKPLVVSSVIRYDANTEKYKAMVWDTDGEVRLFVLNVDDSKIVFEQGTRCSSRIVR